MALNYSDKISFSKTIAEFMHQNKSQLKELGFNVGNRIVELRDKNEKSVIEDAKQEKMKADLVRQTQISKQSINDAYSDASNVLDVIVGVLGKSTPMAKRLRKLREQMHYTKKKKDDNKQNI